MQKCALCEFDYENVSLQEGRCPQCGSIVEWPEEPEIPTTPRPETGVDTDSTSSEKPAEISTAAQSTPGATNDRQVVEEKTIPPVLPKADANATSMPKEMDQLWRESIQGVSDVRCTLKGPETSYTVSDSVFAILPREVRSPLNVSDSPVDYELLDIIGQGGVGVVYTARQASIDRTVAIKMLRDEYRSRNEHQEKFLAEAILTGELDHPNIVPIYDLGRNKQGELFYSMKNVIGTPWDRVITQKTTRENIDILLKVADAVAFAHSRSVVHRDLKPENVMLGSFGEVLVMDWGIAVATEGFRRTSSILRSQAMGGTPAYMAPELATGPMSAIGPAADVYLLGAILFEILTGSPPHYGNDVMECVKNAAENIIRETSDTSELMEIAIRAMATLPRRRFRSVQSFQAAIRLYQSHSESLILSDNAETELNKAINTKDYQGFSRAVFAFDEALSLWDENEAARSGLSRAKAAYAETAYEKGDFDLGLSLLAESEEDHQQMIQKLRIAIADRNARQNRFKTIRKLAVALTGFIVVAGSIGMIVISMLYTTLSASKAELEVNIKSEKEQRKLADDAKDLAEKAQGEAKEASAIAVKRRDEAIEEQRNAEEARLESIEQRQQAEESSYFAEIGLVGASIQKNQFSIASEILNQQELSMAKAKIRHWEWGRHRFLVRGGSSDDAVQSVATFPLDDAVECIDRSADGKWIAIGKLTGECELWKTGEKQPFARFRHGRSLTDLDFNSSGNLLASSGVDDDNTGTVCLWRVQDGQDAVLEKKLAMRSGPATTVSFSNDSKSEYVAAGDNKRLGRIWKWREDSEVELRGHFDALTSIEFSPDNDLVVSSSTDGTVRLWKRSNGSEVQRFAGHAKPVLSATFAPNGSQIASGGADQRILLWAVEQNGNRAKGVKEEVELQLRGGGIPIQSFQSLLGHSGTVQEVAFSSDGTKLVSSANDNEVHVWTVPDKSTIVSSTPVQRLRGHGGWVRACRFSVDGTQVFSGSDDRSWKIWRLDSYREKQFLKSDKLAILDARYSPSGETIATAHADGTVGLWNPKSGEQIALLSDGHEYLTNNAKIIREGKRLATAAGDNTLRLWDLQRGTQLAMMEHSGRDGIVSVSQNADWLVAGGDEFGIGIWNLNTLSTPIRIRKWPEKASDKGGEPTIAPVASVAVSNDGKLAIVGDKLGTVEFWDIASGTMANRVFGHSEAVVASFFLPSESKLETKATALTVSSDGSVAWWNCETGEALPRERLRHFASVQIATLSSNGKYLASCASLDDKKTRLWIWDLDTGEKVATKDLTGLLLQDMIFSSTDSPLVFVTTADARDSKKKIWQWNGNADEWKSIGFAGMTPEFLLGAVPTENDSELLTYGGRGARLWRIKDGKELKSFRPSSAIRSLCFDPEGKWLATASDDGTALIWDVAKRASAQKLVGGHSGPIRDLAFSTDGQSVFTSGADGRIVVWDVAKGSQITSGPISQPTVVGNTLRISSDGNAMAVGCDDNSIRLFDSKTLRQTKKLVGHGAAVNTVSFSSDGKWIVSGSQDKTIRVWSLASGKEIAKLLGHSAPLSSVVFSSDGLRVLSASQDTTVRLWDIGRLTQSRSKTKQLDSGESNSSLGEVLSLEYHSSETTVAEFSPDGRTILTAGVDDIAVLWPSERVPPSIHINNPNQTYQNQEGLKRIDAMAVLHQSGTLDLDGATINFRLEGSEETFGELAIDTRDKIFSVDGGMLIYHSATQVPVTIGTVSGSVGTQIRATFSRFATHVSVEELIRHFAFQGDGRTKADSVSFVDVTIEILDREGRSGNCQPEKVRITRMEESKPSAEESDDLQPKS